jgi:type III pantothenate kinase
LNKIALFNNFILVKRWNVEDSEFDAILGELNSQNQISHCIFSTVRKDSLSLSKKLNAYHPLAIHFKFNTKIPIGISYETPETVGTDRLANCVAANTLYSGSDCLVVDFGTCITYSLLSDGCFSGGAISPGLKMRFKAVYHFTGRLPLVEPSENPAIIGKSTEASIRSGVQHAVILEVDAMIHTICSHKNVSNVLITGGDLAFFEYRLKSRTFADPNLTVKGLNEILEYNAK